MAKFTKKQILNITTGILHTEMGDIYKFFDTVIADGVMTHMLPNCLRAVSPIMKSKYPDFSYEPIWFKDIQDGNDEYEIEFTEEEKRMFWNNYEKLPSLI